MFAKIKKFFYNYWYCFISCWLVVLFLNFFYCNYFLKKFFKIIKYKKKDIFCFFFLGIIIFTTSKLKADYEHKIKKSESIYLKKLIDQVNSDPTARWKVSFFF